LTNFARFVALASTTTVGVSRKAKLAVDKAILQQRTRRWHCNVSY